jgi:integrase
MRQQAGQIVRHRKRWYVRYWERRVENGALVRKRINHYLGPLATRGKRVPTEIQQAAEQHMANVHSGVIPAERIVTIGDFVEKVYLPWSNQHKRPSTAKSYRDIWEHHLRPLCAPQWLKDTRTYHAQGWLDQIGKGGLSRNTLKHVKSVISGVFTLAKQQNYFDGINPAQNTAINPNATEPEETYAYSLEEIQSILGLLPEPAATAFAVAAFMGLRHGEIQGLLWENYRDREIFVSRSIWNGRISEPKTRSGRAPVPVIKQLSERLEMHRLRCGNPVSGPIFSNAVGKPRALASMVNRTILPALNRCLSCGKPERDHDAKADHSYERDTRLPEWKGWHAARRGLGSNLYRLGVPEKVIQRILRHANVNTTATYYIKTAADDVRTAMTKLENHIEEACPVQSDTIGTPNLNFPVKPSTVQ